MSRRFFSNRKLAIALLGGTLILMAPAGCSDDPTSPVNPRDDVDTDIHADDGYVGVVIDTRAIFRKGYVATTVRLAFEDFPAHSATLDIDPTTNLAILSVDTDDLTDDELTAFLAGVRASLVIYDDQQKAVLAEIDEDELVLDNSNRPLSISTDLAFIRRPVDLRQDLPYLLQIKGQDYLVEIEDSEHIKPNTPYALDDINQQFHFTPVAGSDDTYWVENLQFPAGTAWCTITDGSTWLRFETPSGGAARADLVFEQDQDGWVQIRLKETDQYLVFDPAVPGAGPTLRLTTEEPDRFRLISDQIDWLVADRGTVFNQPIMPPARLDFAYRGTLRNCSPGTLEEQIGRSVQKTRTTTIGTSESLQLFASATLSMSAKIGFSVTAKVGVDVKGIGEVGEEVTVSEEISVGSSFTTSSTTTSENTWSSSKSTTEEVSRVRTITVPPNTAVEAYDAVKTIEHVRVPFTQVLRITGTNKDDGIALTGREIRSQMLFNFVGGVITAVGENYVDISFRGNAIIDQLFEATTNVVELEGACD